MWVRGCPQDFQPFFPGTRNKGPAVIAVMNRALDLWHVELIHGRKPCRTLRAEHFLVALQGDHPSAPPRVPGPFKNNPPALLLNDALKFFMGRLLMVFLYSLTYLSHK